MSAPQASAMTGLQNAAEPPSSPRLMKAAGFISLAYVLSRGLGYVREGLLAARFGATQRKPAVHGPGPGGPGQQPLRDCCAGAGRPAPPD